MMVPQRNQLSKQPPPSKRAVQAVIETVTYRGCAITLRHDVKADGIICGSYEVTSIAGGAAWQGTSEGLPESSDPRYLLEVAKCEVDFVLEVDA